MKEQLTYYGLNANHRVRAFSQHSIRIPKELSVALPSECLRVSADKIINYTWPDHTTDESSFSTSSLSSSSSHKANVIVRTLCGRPKNSRRELIVTLSHLRAIHEAVNDLTNPGPYAMILEDDMQFAYTVNWKLLLDSAPPDFAVLQLVTSNEFAVMNLYNVFTRHNRVWVKRVPKDDYWCAGAYIINKLVLKPLIDGIMSTLADGTIQADIIAGYEGPCWPKYCCSKSKFNTSLPGCVLAARGFQADHYVFSLVNGATYMLTVPMLTGSLIGNTSTLHQEHVHVHNSAFNRIRKILTTELLTPSFFSKRPAFITSNCSFHFNESSRRVVIAESNREYVYDIRNVTEKVIARRRSKFNLSVTLPILAEDIV